jgi:hypothetical protein
VLVVALAGWLAWHEGRSHRSTIPAVVANDATLRAAAPARLSAEVDTLEKTFQRALESGAAADAASLLDQAIERQRERVALDSGVNAEQAERLARLEARRSTLRAGAAAAQSVALENEALAAQQAGQSAGVAEKLREALRLQREANAGAGAAGAQNFPREARLAQAIALAEAEPWHTAAETALALAHAAVAQEHWDDALKAYAEARAAQAAINQQHPATRYANPAQLDAIDGEIASLQAAGAAAAAMARARW